MSRSHLLTLATVAVAAAVSAVGVALDPQAGPLDALFGTVVLTALLTALRLAARAGRRALAERRRARELTATPAEDVARCAVVDERARLAADIQAVVRRAATEIRAAAETADRDWDRDPAPALHAVQDQGGRAGVELRRLLGLLRDASEDPDLVPSAAPAAATGWIGRRDLAVAGAVAALTLVENVGYAAVDAVGLGWVSLVLSALVAATLVLRRAAPGLGAACCGLVFTVSAGTQVVPNVFGVLGAVAVLAFAAMARYTLRDAMGAVLLAAGVAWGTWVQDSPNFGFMLVLMAAAGVAGAAVGWSDARGAAARARADRQAAAHAAAAEQAVRAERLTVARDLHDVVSHAVGVMVVQAGAALALYPADAIRARRALDLVRGTAGDTLDELDRLVTVIDAGAFGAPVTGPVQHDVRALVDRMRAAGLAVDLDGPGVADPAVYRIVQESLTNALRHAPGAAVHVRVRTGSDGTEVEIIDDGPGPVETSGRGYGLIGVAERVQRLGGDLTTGPGPAGRGFRVYARLPALAEVPL